MVWESHGFQWKLVEIHAFSSSLGSQGDLEAPKRLVQKGMHQERVRQAQGERS